MSVNKVPVEIWEDIVELCIEDRRRWDISRRLSQVNKHFRKTLFSTPKPWRRLHLPFRDLASKDTLRSQHCEWASEMNKRAENSVKHIKLNVDDSDISDISSIEKLLEPFTTNNTLDSFYLLVLETSPSKHEGWLCSPRAKRLSVQLLSAVDKCFNNIKFVPNEVTEDVECVDLRLTSPSTDSKTKAASSLKSASIDLMHTYSVYVRYQQKYEDGLIRKNPIKRSQMIDNAQFDAISASHQLESLQVAYTDSRSDYRGLSLPSLKSLTVKGSRCNFLGSGRLPALDEHPSMERTLKDSKLKHLHILHSDIPAFNFNKESLVSLSFESCPVLYNRDKKTLGGFNVSGLTSLKALNLSFTTLGLKQILALLENVEVEQLICDIPLVPRWGDYDALQSAIASKVKYYWTDIQQYYEDVSENDELEQYFFPVTVADVGGMDMW